MVGNIEWVFSTPGTPDLSAHPAIMHRLTVVIGVMRGAFVVKDAVALRIVKAVGL
jgi:hypothetical protein